MENELFISQLKLHIIVVIYGFTAILGKLIQLPAYELVWFRMLIAVIFFFIYLRIKNIDLSISKGDFLRISMVGVVVAAHWIAFFGAIKLSNVSVTLGCFATTTLFTSFLEPFFFRKKVNWLEVLTGIIIIAGLYLIFTFEMHYVSGILVALLSAFLAALFTVLNKKLIAKHPASVISFYELLGGWFVLTLFFLIPEVTDKASFALPTASDLAYLFLLGTVCTAYAFVIQIDVMKHLSAYMVTLTINLEPVYGIIMAFLFFGESEKMTAGFYIGTLIILLSVLSFPMMNKYYSKLQRVRANRID